MNEKRVPAEARLYIFGDSICFGQFVSPHRVWATRLAAALESDMAPHGLNVLVQNPSVNGNTSRQGLERAPYDFQIHKPDLVFIQFGMNDCNYWDTDLGLPRVSPDAFRVNMVEMARRAFQHGARQVFMPTNHPTLRTTERLVKGTVAPYEESNHRYAGILREAAAEAGATLIDTRAAFEAEIVKGTPLAQLVEPDGLHLNKAGHDIYFRLIHPAIRNALLAWTAADMRV